MAASRTAFRKWSWVHKWSSLVCTLFMLLLCVTGLPLIFHEEIDEILHEQVKPADVPKGTPKANLDRVARQRPRAAPGQVTHFLIWDPHEDNTLFLSVGKSIDVDPSTNRFVRVDAHTADYLDTPDFTRRFTYIMFKLHVDLFAGLPGKLFLGLMGILFCVAIISGIVVYAPSMRKLQFGTYRRDRNRVVRWLDVHNLAGVVLVMWTLVVGFTGVINTWADLVVKMWQYGQLAEMTASYRDKPLVTRTASLDAAMRSALAVEPDMKPSFIAFPGTLFSSKAHYAVFLRGNTPLTSRMLKPVLIDAETGQVTDSREMPWYVSTLLLSQPLHFGDYGGMPMKIIWAVLDVFTIAVLITGLYLWLRRRRTAHSVRRMVAMAKASRQTAPAT